HAARRAPTRGRRRRGRHERGLHRRRRAGARTASACGSCVMSGQAHASHGSFRRRLAALTRKEFRQLLRDPSNLAIGIVLPIVLILIFGYGLSLDTRDAPLAVVLEDASPTARDVVAGLAGSPYLSPTWVNTFPEAEQLLRERRVD